MRFECESNPFMDLCKMVQYSLAISDSIMNSWATVETMGGKGAVAHALRHPQKQRQKNGLALLKRARPGLSKKGLKTMSPVYLPIFQEWV